MKKKPIGEVIRRTLFTLILGPVALFFAVGCLAVFPLMAVIWSLLDGWAGAKDAWSMCWHENLGVEMFLTGWERA